MGKRGPKKKAARATPEPSRPYAPRGLDAEATAAWGRVCDDLEAAGTLDRADRHLIELYARTYSMWARVGDQIEAECCQMIAESFPKVSSRKQLEAMPADGEPQSWPFRLSTLHSNLTGRLRQILLDLGLSPSTRRPRPEAPNSPMGRMLAGGGGGL